MFITDHANDRICRRLADYITRIEVVDAVFCHRRYEVGETHILVKKLPHEVAVYDGPLILSGDEIWAVVKKRNKKAEPFLATVMVRSSVQPQRGDHVIK